MNQNLVGSILGRSSIKYLKRKEDFPDAKLLTSVKKN
jgi:hypothetical protein